MRNLSRRERLRLVLPAVTAAIIPSIILLPHGSGAAGSVVVRGAIVGLLIGINIVAMIGLRTGCRAKNAS